MVNIKELIKDIDHQINLLPSDSKEQLLFIKIKKELVKKVKYGRI